MSYLNSLILMNFVENQLYIDPKSSFQEAAQEKLGVTPSYKVVRETGPDHAKSFVVAVCLEKEEVARGEGKYLKRR